MDTGGRVGVGVDQQEAGTEPRCLCRRVGSRLGVGGDMPAAGVEPWCLCEHVGVRVGVGVDPRKWTRSVGVCGPA